MLGAKLGLLLLLGLSTSAQQDVETFEEHSPLCFLAKRYGHFKRFVYNYEAETFNVNDASDIKSGPKVSCTVEVDVPQTCNFILRTTDCSLSEIFGVDEHGKPIYADAAKAKDFRDAMAKNPLRVAVEKQSEVKLYPEDDEPVNILNIKRGIVSALMVPDVTEETTEDMPTVHGVCPTDITFNPWEEVATDVTVIRDLSRCDQFTARRQHTSPLALISGMHYPLSKLMNSTQTCNYKFDSQTKHMTSSSCTEKHIFMPFSYKNANGMSSIVKQTVTLRETENINDRIFGQVEANLKHLPMEAAEDMSPVQSVVSVIGTMQTLNDLPHTLDGKARAGLFHDLVSQLRGLKADVLGSAIDQMLDTSSALTWQALVQCGTPECTSAILKILRTYDNTAMEVDAIVYAMGMLQNPSRLLVNDLLEMAQYKQSKPIMYALSIVTRRLYQSEGVTPEITAVYEFVSAILGADCAGEKEQTFLTLRVLGNMGDAMESVNTEIKTTLLKCMRQPATTLSVQMAAIQAFRRMSVTDKVRADIQRVSQYGKGAVQKRLAAYLILMRNPQDSDLEMVKKLLTQEKNDQVKAFVTSHIYNIISSNDPETKSIGAKIMEALEDPRVAPHHEYTTQSRNYKLGVGHDNWEAAIQGNIIFDPSSQLPREVLLETTLEAFGYSMDIWEVGMDGKGFEPTLEALFGKNGFFPDTVSKALYWAEGKVPDEIKEVLEKWISPVRPEGQEIPDNLLKEIVRNFNTLVKDLNNAETPEAMAYLRIMGAELGYIKASDLKSFAEMYINIFKKITPNKVLSNLMASPQNDIFAHYIFMDNKLVMPTSSGLPLTFALSGTFAPGAKGGFHIEPSTKSVTFNPSVGVEFMTQMGIHVPEFVESSMELRTTLYHESDFRAKITMEPSQVKFSIPAPQHTIQFLSLSNKMTIVGPGRITESSLRSDDASCSRLFAGVQYCIRKLQPDNRNPDAYLPLTGEMLYAIDIKPTNGVSEYTTTIAYKLLSEGNEGRHKVDSLKVILRAEGAEPSEATATLKYNRNRNIFTTQIQIPDFDVETGIKIAMTGSSARGKSVLLEVSNKNELQLSLAARAKVQAMTDGLLQVQATIPSLRVDATLGATMSKADELTLQFKSDVKLPEMASIQTVTFRYSEEQAEIQVMSNMNADTKVPVEHTKALNIWIQQLAEDMMNQQVVNTDMKLRHILNKGIEAGNIWVEKISTEVPYIRDLKNSIAAVEMPSMPENLFMNLESTMKYKFNQNRFAMTIPLPLGGKSSEELRVPKIVTLPQVSVPQLGMDLAPQEFNIPTFTIPDEYDLTFPLMGLMEMSAKMESNYYQWDGKMTAGNNTNDSPNYVANFKIKAESPLRVLSFSTEGAYAITDTEGQTIEISVDGSFEHMLINTSFNVAESFAVTENVLAIGRYNMKAASPMGLDASTTITTQCTLDSSILFGDLNADTSVRVGPKSASSTYLYTFSVEPAKKLAKMESTLNANVDTTKLSNKAKVFFENDEFLFESNTNMNSEPVRHTTKITLSYKDSKLAFQSDSVTDAHGERLLRSQMELSAAAAQATLRIENTAEYSSNRIYSLLTGSMNPSGMEINADASMNIFSSIASHKATLTLNTNGLTTSCTTTAHHSPLTFENIFHGGVDTSGATLSLKTKGGIKDNKAELEIEGKLAKAEGYINGMFKANLLNIDSLNRVNLRLNEDGLVYSSTMVGSLGEMRTENTNSASLTLRSFTLQSKTDNFLDKSNSYMHDVSINVERYTASVSVKNILKVLAISFENDAQFNAQPYNVELSGTMKGVYSEEELKHTYEIKVIDAVFSTKCNTVGKLLGSQITHTTDTEVAGLSVKFNSLTNVNSPSVRLYSTVKTSAEPFVLNIDALFNSDGIVHMYGRHSGEINSKFLLKAEPSSLTESLEYRASTTHELEGKPIINTNMDGKYNSILNFQEQSMTLKMTSKLNDHAVDEEMTAYNNAERMGIEMRGAISTPILSETSQDYVISGFVKYDKSSDSHFIQIPFVEYLPAAIENIKTSMVALMDLSMDKLKNLDSKYEISSTIKSKVAELKEVIDNFDYNLFVQDLKMSVIPMERYFRNLTAKLPVDKVIAFLKSIKEKSEAAIKNCDISAKLKTAYSKFEEFLSKYEVEKIVGSIMDEAVEIMKQYHVRELIQQTFDYFHAIDVQPLVKKVMIPLQELLQELYSFDFKMLIEDMTEYFMRMIQKIRSFDYDTFTTQLKEKVAEMTKIPCFGKLYGEFKIDSPHYKLTTTADMENITTTSVTPQFQMNLNSRAESTLKVLDFTTDAMVLFSVPKMSYVSITESVKVGQSSFTLDHLGKMNLYGLSVQGSANTTAKIMTELYDGQMMNTFFFATKNGAFASMETAYKHNANFQPLSLGSESVMNQKTVFGLEAGTARLTFNNMARSKSSAAGFSDETSHLSDMEVVADLHTAKITFTGDTKGNNMKLKQNALADICIFRHVILEAKAETEMPLIKESIAEIKFQAKVEDMRVDITATHNTELIGQVEGVLSNNFLALATPREILLDTKNKFDLPITPLGKVDLLNDMAFTLNSEVQQARWKELVDFDKYKYSHLLSMDNLDKEINVVGQIKAEADLEVLRQPITIPEIAFPWVGVKTPTVEDFSLWEDTGLDKLLITTQQGFDMNSKLKYVKNPEVIQINVGPVIQTINTNLKALRENLHVGKDKVATVLASSYDNAKVQYEKYSSELPETITVPAYKVPVINYEMSSFKIALPDAAMFTLPSLDVSNVVSKLRFPRISLPKIQTIRIPVLGDLTYELSVNTEIITLKTDASLLNQDGLIMTLEASSSSQYFPLLVANIEGNTKVDTAGEFKVASIFSADHSILEGKHMSTIIISYETMETSITNSAKLNLPSQTLEIKQEISGSPKGLVFAMSSESGGLLAVQMQTKQPATVKARVYGRYPTEMTKDVDIVGLKMSLVDLEKLSLQASWNLEMPYEMMLGLKKQVPVVVDMVSDPAAKAYNRVSRRIRGLKGTFEKAKRQGKVMFNRAVESIVALDLSDALITVTEKSIWILQEYQKTVKLVLDAVVRFLRETRFQLPGYEQKLSGLEIYKKFSGLIADVIEEAIQKITDYIANVSSAILEKFQAIEFAFPGSDRAMSGKEFLDELLVVLRKIQDQAIISVRKIGEVSLEDISQKFNGFMQLTIDQSEKFIQTLRSLDAESLSSFVSSVYDDAMNSQIFANVADKVKEVYGIIAEYLKVLCDKINNVLADVSANQLRADIQSWIDSSVKRFNALHNSAIRALKEKTKDVEPYVRITDRQIDVDIPLPFAA